MGPGLETKSYYWIRFKNVIDCLINDVENTEVQKSIGCNIKWK